MSFASVAVNSPFAGRRSYTYSIPVTLQLAVGQAVWVPFGAKILQGIVVGLSEVSDIEGTKDIHGFITDAPLLNLSQIRLALWISAHYLCPLFDAVSLMLPPGFERKLVTYIEPEEQTIDTEQLSEEQRKVIYFLQEQKNVSLKQLEKLFGKQSADRLIRQLISLKMVRRVQRLEKIKIKPRQICRITLAIPSTDSAEIIERLGKGRANRQIEILRHLQQRGGAALLPELKEALQCQQSVINVMQKNKLLSVEYVDSRRDLLQRVEEISAQIPALTSSQNRAVQLIRSSTLSSDKAIRVPPVFLLHGVTGSGKTEVYLRALADVIARGKRGICLVPEISLTPQMIQRFTSRFPGRVGVMHSGLSLREQFDEWYRIYEGDFDVVIGPRSVLFVPQPDIGLIIIDEEHEWTYKQTDRSPRYHARDVAIKYAELLGDTIVILGSATPDVETYSRAQSHWYDLIELGERISPDGLSSRLPDVKIIDMRDELRSGNRGILSLSLQSSISTVLERHEQAILFLNRRGTATFIRCSSCGFVMGCKRCSAALAYHAQSKRLLCHHCHYSLMLPTVCPQCKRGRLLLLGVGTQKVEEEISMLFPGAKILRWDSDTTTTADAHEKFLGMLKNREVDILIGTQMIAKGLDLPAVTLAAVINADTALNLPDFRAGERTFQLLCQLAGRAGRGFLPGYVIIQTFAPEHYAICAAAQQDYKSFFKQEIEYRRQFSYPPFSHMARLVHADVNAERCQQEAERVSQMLKTEVKRKGISLRFIGPVPAFSYRVRGRYLWQLLLYGRAPEEFLSSVDLPRDWILDIDPIGVI